MRGEIWTAAAREAYTGKPRPVVIIQSDFFDATDWVTVCPLTTDLTNAPLLRVPIEPSPDTGLEQPCRMMVDKLTRMPRTNMSSRLGRLSDADMVRMERSMVVFLGLA
jgi:mRNA interferase MazF